MGRRIIPDHLKLKRLVLFVNEAERQQMEGYLNAIRGYASGVSVPFQLDTQGRAAKELYEGPPGQPDYQTPHQRFLQCCRDGLVGFAACPVCEVMTIHELVAASMEPRGS